MEWKTVVKAKNKNKNICVSYKKMSTYYRRALVFCLPFVAATQIAVDFRAITLTTTSALM